MVLGDDRQGGSTERKQMSKGEGSVCAADEIVDGNQLRCQSRCSCQHVRGRLPHPDLHHVWVIVNDNESR